MDENSLDPDTEQELRDAMKEATDGVRDDGMEGLAKYVGAAYRAFRTEGFTRKQSFSFSALLLQSLLSRG